MKQKFFIFFGVIVVIGLLIGLNAASLSQKEKEADREVFPNRSTYNTGATGTRAFYDLLSETGRQSRALAGTAVETFRKKSKHADGFRHHRSDAPRDQRHGRTRHSGLDGTGRNARFD